MGLMDELRTRQKEVARLGKTCRIATILDGLDKKDADDLREALDRDSGIGHSTIARVLSDRGDKVSDGMVGYHRNGRCSCHEPR